MVNLKNVQQLADETVAFCREHALSRSPDVYGVVYRYLSGDPALVGVIDRLVEAGLCTNETLLSLEGNSIVTDESDLSCLMGVVEVLVSNAQEVGRVLGVSEASFSAVKRELKSGGKVLSKQQITTITDALIRSSEAATHSVGKMEVALSSSADEIMDLKASLNKTRQQVEMDALTGLGNRVYLSRVFAALYKKRSTLKQGVSMVVMDIDNFKKLNDTHGHVVGDSVLSYVAQQLKTLSHVAGYHAVRYGGEEFVLLFEDHGLAEVISLVKQMRAAFSVKKIIRKDTRQRLGAVTGSFGIAHVFADDVARDAGGLVLETLISRADKAMYQAKRAGKDTVFVAPGVTL